MLKSTIGMISFHLSIFLKLSFLTWNHCIFHSLKLSCWPIALASLRLVIESFREQTAGRLLRSARGCVRQAKQALWLGLGYGHLNSEKDPNPNQQQQLLLHKPPIIIPQPCPPHHSPPNNNAPLSSSPRSNAPKPTYTSTSTNPPPPSLKVPEPQKQLLFVHVRTAANEGRNREEKLGVMRYQGFGFFFCSVVVR